jgi:hypothetical protein
MLRGVPFRLFDAHELAVGGPAHNRVPIGGVPIYMKRNALDAGPIIFGCQAGWLLIRDAWATNAGNPN